MMASEIESVLTSSSQADESTISISFDNISYNVRTGLCGKGKKQILKDVSGEFNAGELSVIMGQSGAGKSCLMDILSGYTKPTSGIININGKLRNENFRKRSCYILQDDRIQETLTIRESLYIAAELKLGNHINSQQKRRRIEQILSGLKMEAVQHTRAGNLSGGEKKRLAIGLELISDPTVMFLDEPISGLDCSISKQVVGLLRDLARQGRTVVVSIHQPSAILLSMVDRLYALVAGQCAYMGSVSQLRPYLEQMHLTCPPYHNTVDFLIEKCDSENMNKLVKSSDNGKNRQWLNTLNVSEYNELSILSIGDETSLTALPLPKENPTNKILLTLKSTYSTSRWKQFTTLTRRSLLITWRDPTFELMNGGIHLGMALFVGTLYHNIAGDAADTLNNFHFLYFSLMFIMFTAFSAVIIRFPEQIPVVRREHFNRWYTTSAYYASVFVTAIPMQTIYTIIFGLITYLLTGQLMEFRRFSIYMATLIMVSYVAVSMGLLNGSIFNVKNGVVFGMFLLMPFTIFSGFFIRITEAPIIFKWLFHISFMKHGLVGLMISIYGMDRLKQDCNKADMCFYRQPDYFLETKDMDKEDLPHVWKTLFAICAVVIIVSYFILRIRLKNKW